MCNHFVNIQSFHKSLGANLILIGAAFLFLLFRQNVNVATQQLRGQLDVLTAAADGDWELFLRYNYLDTVIVFIQNNLGNFCRSQSADNKLSLVFRIGNNVNFFTLQFGNHGLNANTAQTHTGADGINRHIVRSNGNFSLRTRITGNTDDFNNAVINFRNLWRKQFGQKLGTSPG